MMNPTRARKPRLSVPEPTFIPKSGEDRIGRRKFGWR